jgi:hypothetical protein
MARSFMQMIFSGIGISFTDLQVYRFVLRVSSLLFFLLCLKELWDHGTYWPRWDLLLISGVAAFILGIRLSLNIPNKLKETLVRLMHRGVLEITEERLQVFESDFQKKADVWAHRLGLIIAFAILVAFIVAFGLSSIKISLTVLEVLGGYIAGSSIGIMAWYGRLGLVLKQHRIPIKVLPGHLDGAAGLKPLGDIYFRQAMLIGIPALYLAVWQLIIQFKLVLVDYRHWSGGYAGLLVLPLLLEILAFLMPLWSFHQEMLIQKKKHLQDADQLSLKINKVQDALITEHPAEQRELLKDQLSSMTKQYWDIENMPTWPVDVKTKRLFLRNNLVLLLPLINEFVSSKDIKQYAEKLVEGITGK